MAPIIQVKDLVKKYQKSDKNAVDGVSFNVEQGEFFSLLGPNGAGKTTTISILTTTLSKTSGSAKIAGFDIDSQASEVRRNVGIIFQNPSLDQNLTAEENVRMHAVLYGMYPFNVQFSSMNKDYQARVYELAGILGLSSKEIFKPIKTFSGGMKRKLEIIRSLMHHPKVLFLDEPTVGLDPLSRKDLWEYLKEMRKKEGTTIFLTTHYLDESEYSDRVCIINNGKVVEIGKPEEIKNKLTMEYLILDADDKLKLRMELERLGLKFEHDGEFKVFLDGKSTQEVIKNLDVHLTMLKTHSPSLEEAYLSIINHSGGEGK